MATENKEDWEKRLEGENIPSKGPENILDRFKRKSKENPIVPAGFLVACAGVVFMVRALRRKDPNAFQKAQRLRLFGSMTVVSAIAGGWVVNNKERLLEDWEKLQGK
ncbi:hypothetical protein BC833DRAFT_584811 [Globomyces pollinis-pini]|nr:hypothetical protein BC833DRAFT_584811 [Globomyces pollinis-pini]KAJ2997071.1 hypothetical protein HDV02_005885 [Globomyces sp. JEL0801]